MNKKLQYWLKAAALYNCVWGLFTILFPNFIFEFSNLAPLNYPEIWQCVGMIVGVYGIGYYIASFNYIKHWPIVLVGFLGKIAGPIGFGNALLNGKFNIQFGTTIIFNDIIWWIPFFLMLKEAWIHSGDSAAKKKVSEV